MKTFFAINRHNKTVVELKNFASWEIVQGCFRVGIQMPDGSSANGIGRCSSTADLVKRAAHSGFNLLPTQF